MPVQSRSTFPLAAHINKNNVNLRYLSTIVKKNKFDKKVTIPRGVLSWFGQKDRHTGDLDLTEIIPNLLFRDRL
jgi:hypothetical protein